MIRIGATLIGLLLLSGCAVEQRANNNIALGQAQTAQGLASLRTQESLRSGGAQVSSRAFVAPERERDNANRRLPAPLNARSDISIISREPLGLIDISARLNEITGVPHVVALGPSGVNVTTARPTVPLLSDDVQEVVNQLGEQQQSALAITADGASSRAASLRIRPNLSGSLAQVLDSVATAFEVDWEYVDGRVLFRDYVTRQYQVALLPVSASFTGTNSSASVDLWSEVETGLRSLVGEGTQVSIGRASGIVTVTGLLRDQARIRDYIAEINDTVGQPINLDVAVLTVTLDDRDSLGVQLTASDIFDNGAVIGVGGSQAEESIGTLTVGIINGTFQLTAVVDALSAPGRVTRTTRTGATTTNFQPVPIRVTDQQAYVASITREEDDEDGDITITTEVETLETGIVLSLLPRILNTRELLLRYSIDLSDLIALEDFGALEERIQLPEVSQTVLEQQVILRTGQSLVLAGFERDRSETSRRAPGNSNFTILGGSREAQVQRIASVIIITPRLLPRLSNQ